METSDMTKILVAVIAAVGAITTTLITVRFKNFKEQIFKKIEEVENKIGDKPDPNFVKQIHDQRNHWISVCNSPISVKLANMMEYNLLSLYDDIQVHNYTMLDYNRTLSLIDSVRSYSYQESQLLFISFPEKIKEDMQKIINKNVQNTLVKLHDLATDNVFNNKRRRLQKIFVEYAQNYTSDMINFIIKNDI
jgi:hypothetical protein